MGQKNGCFLLRKKHPFVDLFEIYGLLNKGITCFSCKASNIDIDALELGSNVAR